LEQTLENQNIIIMLYSLFLFFVIAESNLIIIFTIFPGSTYFKWFCSFYIYIVNGGTRCLHRNQYSKISGSCKYTGTIKCQTFIYILRKRIGANFVFSQNVNFNLDNSNYILGNTNINLGNSNFILCNTNFNLVLQLYTNKYQNN